MKRNSSSVHQFRKSHQAHQSAPGSLSDQCADDCPAGNTTRHGVASGTREFIDDHRLRPEDSALRLRPVRCTLPDYLYLKRIPLGRGRNTPAVNAARFLPSQRKRERMATILIKKNELQDQKSYAIVVRQMFRVSVLTLRDSSGMAAASAQAAGSFLTRP